MLLEAQAHNYLHGFLRQQGDSTWPHNLTMARLVARALRLGRSALIQTSSPIDRYSISYLTPALLDEAPVLIVLPESAQKKLLAKQIPQLKNTLNLHKEVISGIRWPQTENFSGLMLTTPEAWLDSHLNHLGYFPPQVTTIIDQADDLEQWARKQLTKTLQPKDWEELWQGAIPYRDLITDIRVKLTKALFSHPPNLEECYLIGEIEQQLLDKLFTTLKQESLLTPAWERFWQQSQPKEQMFWASVARDTGQFSLYLAPQTLGTSLSEIWTKQPIVLIGSFLDSDSKAPLYRDALGLPEMLCLKFAPNRQEGLLNIYLPEGLPLPNTPAFQEALLSQLRKLVALTEEVKKPVVLLVEDRPLRAQVAAVLAAEFGSRVQVEKISASSESILVTGWDFWRQHQEVLTPPQLMAIATLPIPSLENALVASSVAYYKSKRKDWFRLYLLPTALREIQRVVMSVRESQGVLAILDSRVNARSYGNLILNALEPCAKISYVDKNWF